ncbi:hypothetical protein Plhal710r2_c040g0139931 [Plasmopara halstedii]
MHQACPSSLDNSHLCLPRRALDDRNTKRLYFFAWVRARRTRFSDWLCQM